MKISCVFVHNVNSYEGEYAPELIGAADEWTMSDNPDYLEKIYHDAQERMLRGEYDIVKKIEIKISRKEFDSLFFENNVLKGKIL
jgi:hypothetical protein